MGPHWFEIIIGAIFLGFPLGIVATLWFYTFHRTNYTTITLNGSAEEDRQTKRRSAEMEAWTMDDIVR
jgi:hypothetical protein